MTENPSLPEAAESPKEPPRLPKHRQRGSEILEFTLVLIPMLMFVFLILDIGWAVYTRAVLQYAVTQGVRYAVTDQTMTGLQQRASIQTVVQNNAFGRLKGTAGAATGACDWNSICVHFYQINTATGALVDVSSTTGSAPYGNGQLPLVEVSVDSFSQKTFMPTIKLPGLGTTLNAIVMGAAAWDQVESPPMAGSPLP